jgi:hypothetical protein
MKLKSLDYVANKWQRRTGASDEARENYKSGFEPYYKALENVELPPKRKGDPANLERVHTIMNVMRSGSVEKRKYPRERRR